MRLAGMPLGGGTSGGTRGGDDDNSDQRGSLASVTPSFRNLLLADEGTEGGEEEEGSQAPLFEGSLRLTRGESQDLGSQVGGERGEDDDAS